MDADKLTDRQKEVLALFKAGKTPAEIATALKLKTPNAVYNYRRKFEKAGLLPKTKRATSNARRGSGRKTPAKTPAASTPPASGGNGTTPDEPVVGTDAKAIVAAAKAAIKAQDNSLKAGLADLDSQEKVHKDALKKIAKDRAAIKKAQTGLAKATV